MYTNIFSFAEWILLDLDTRDVGLSNLSNSYRCIGPKPRLLLPFKERCSVSGVLVYLECSALSGIFFKLCQNKPTRNMAIINTLFRVCSSYYAVCSRT